MVIVDSTVWIDFVTSRDNEYTFWLEQRMGRDPIGLTDLILMEVLQGVRNDKIFLQVQDRLTQFDVFDTGGQELAIEAAENHRSLRKPGYTVRRQIDCLIATFCIHEGHTLLHRDRDFDAFEHHLGLRVVHPLHH